MLGFRRRRGYVQFQDLICLAEPPTDIARDTHVGGLWRFRPGETLRASHNTCRALCPGADFPQLVEHAGPLLLGTIYCRQFHVPDAYPC